MEEPNEPKVVGENIEVRAVSVPAKVTAAEEFLRQQRAKQDHKRQAREINKRAGNYVK